MKRILLLLTVVFTVCISSYAQKQYLRLVYSNSHVYLSGAIPDGMETNIYPVYSYEYDDYITVGGILNTISSKGYTLENVASDGSCYLFSKNTDSAASASKVQTVKTDDATEVKEIARYNLQGIPVKASEKGLQIIVYSNYTTRTVLVE